jgi:hypothetical protein
MLLTAVKASGIFSMYSLLKRWSEVLDFWVVNAESPTILQCEFKPIPLPLNRQHKGGRSEIHPDAVYNVQLYTHIERYVLERRKHRAPKYIMNFSLSLYIGFHPLIVLLPHHNEKSIVFLDFTYRDFRTSLKQAKCGMDRYNWVRRGAAGGL